MLVSQKQGTDKTRLGERPVLHTLGTIEKQHETTDSTTTAPSKKKSTK